MKNLIFATVILTSALTSAETVECSKHPGGDVDGLKIRIESSESGQVMASAMKRDFYLFEELGDFEITEIETKIHEMRIHFRGEKFWMALSMEKNPNRFYDAEVKLTSKWGDFHQDKLQCQIFE